MKLLTAIQSNLHSPALLPPEKFLTPLDAPIRKQMPQPETGGIHPNSLFSGAALTGARMRNEPPACSHVTTAEEQARLTPHEVLRQFKEGNERFRSGRVTRRNHSEQVRKSAPGQFPKAMVLSCVDSRIPVEDVFDQGIGDVFVGRVAGNFVNADLLGSMEFACKVAGAKMILVMGHQHCGAIRGAIDDVKLGNLTSLLANIKPAVALSQDFEGEKTSANPLFVKRVAENNVRIALANIRSKSPILQEMEEKEEIKIVGAFYRLTDGALEFIE